MDAQILSIADIASVYRLPERTLRDRLARVRKAPSGASKLKYRESHTRRCVMYKVDTWFIQNLLFQVTRGRRPAAAPPSPVKEATARPKASGGLRIPCDVGGVKFTIEFQAEQARKFAEFIKKIGES